MYKTYKTEEPSAPPAERAVPETQVIIDGVGDHHDHHHEELEEDAICRCCQDGEHKEDLIVPCGCTGSVKYVHRKCLDKWRTVAPNPEAFRRCEICHTDYIFKKQDETGGSKTWRTIKFILAVTFDFAVVVGIWQFIVLAFTLLAFLISFKFDVANYFPSAIPKVISYYVVGHLAFFFLMGIVGIILGIVLCIKSCCGGKEERERDREPYTYSSYPYYDSSWDLNLFMCWYFSPWNMYFYSHDPACTAAACCMIGSGNMNFDNCFNGGGGGDSNDCGAFLAVILVVIVAAVIIFGIFIAIYFFITIGAGILNRRVSILKRKSDLPMYTVVDRRDLSAEALAMATH